MTAEERASNIYAPLAKGSVSKSVTAQYLVRVLSRTGRQHIRAPEVWKTVLPAYIVEAIEHVTADTPAANAASAEQDHQ